MVLVYQVWFLEVLAAFAVLLCLLKCRLIAVSTRLLASSRQQTLPGGQRYLVEPPDLPWRSFSRIAASCLTVYAHRTHGQGSDLGSRASFPVRFVDHKMFEHPLLQLTNEILSTITIVARVAPRL